MLPLLYQSKSGNPPLRIGILLDSAELLSFFAEIVNHIQQSNFASLELLVYNAEEQSNEAAPSAPSSPIKKGIDLLFDGPRRRAIMYRLYQRWDRRNIDAANDPLAMVDCSAAFAHVEAMAVTPIRKRFVHRFQPADIQAIRAKNLDVLIRFGFNILRGDILTCAKYGVWSYHNGDNDYYRGGPAYFWEVYEQNPLSGAILQVLTEALDDGKVLSKGVFETYPGMSQARNRMQSYWGSSTFIIQKLSELHQHGWAHLERTKLPPAPYLGKKKIYTTPSNWEMVRWLVPTLARKALQWPFRRAMAQHWRMAIRCGGQSLLDSGTSPNMNGFRTIEAPKGHFYADPFLVEDEGKPWLFFEDYIYKTGRGNISCAEVTNGEIGNAVLVLERPYHLSYPCVFRDGGEWFMIPETAANGTVELYRCLKFPHRWELHKKLFGASAVDTTLWVEDGVYWFFTSLREPRGRATQLWLFHATSLTGDWTAHPSNPISTDVRNSRGAGAIFRHNGKLFRPSQDCSRHYGYSFTLNEILTLTLGDYAEKAVVTVNPLWAEGLAATHSYSRAGEVEIIDGCWPVPEGSV